MICRRSLGICLAAALLPAGTHAADWLAWRGPLGTGHSEEKSLPLTWSKTENVKWSVSLDGDGNSSPIVVGQKVFITHAPKPGNLRGLRCYDRQTGQLLWKHEVEYAEKEQTHNTNPACAASPVSDGQRVVAWYGSAGFYCYDLDGKILWQKDLGKVEHIWGYGSSPLLYENLVILNFGPGLNAFVAAYDKHSGDEVWRKEFPEQKSPKVEDYRGSWSTPVVGDASAARTLLLLSLPEKLYACDPKSGEEIWSCGGLANKLVYTSPLVAGDIVVVDVRLRRPGDGRQGRRQGRRDRNAPPVGASPQSRSGVGSGVVVDGACLHPQRATARPGASIRTTGEKKWEEPRVGGDELELDDLRRRADLHQQHGRHDVRPGAEHRPSARSWPRTSWAS